MYSVIIGGEDIYETYGFMLAKKQINAPNVQTHFISVPMRNGSIDVTEYLSGKTKYDDREIDITLKYVGNSSDFYRVYTKLNNYIHGKRLEIIFTDDADYYYVGRIEVGKESHTTHSLSASLKCTCEPFKYNRSSSDEDWLWDTLDFDYGYVNEGNDVAVNGTTDFTMIAEPYGGAPSFTTDSDMTVAYNGTTYTLNEGTTKLYDMELAEGENTLTFTGNGTVTIHYRGGAI